MTAGLFPCLQRLSLRSLTLVRRAVQEYTPTLITTEGRIDRTRLDESFPFLWRIVLPPIRSTWRSRSLERGEQPMGRSRRHRAGWLPCHGTDNNNRNSNHNAHAYGSIHSPRLVPRTVPASSTPPGACTQYHRSLPCHPAACGAPGDRLFVVLVLVQCSTSRRVAGRSKGSEKLALALAVAAHARRMKP